MNSGRTLFIIWLSLQSFLAPVDAGVAEDFNAGWLFSKGDFAAAMMPGFDDSAWRQVSAPHDWSSEGPFGAEYASGNGYAPGGIGWYRRHFQLSTNQMGMVVTIEFDGVYDYSEVWINGQFVGGRPYGYSSFQCELTPFVKFGARDNVVSVRVDHSRFADSRYYTGSGIYRNARLMVMDKLHVGHWGVCVTTPEVSSARATVRIATTIANESALPRQAALQTTLLAPNGTVAAQMETAVTIGGNSPGREVTQQFTLPSPRLWNPDDPELYRAVSKIISNRMTIDETTTPFGIRKAVFDSNKGFFLNEKPMKLKGVCLHHDAGPLGAAVPYQVLERRLRALKEIGVNAIRTSHNPPDPGLLDLCDQLGFLVMDEAFDEFTPSKNKWVTGRNSGVPSRFGYGEIFAQWSVRDLEDMIRRDRNHPSVILWSIGNEVDYPNDPFSHPVLGNSYHPENPPAEDMARCAQPLVEAVKSLDPTRPVTAALANVSMSDAAGLSQLLDAVGYNYQESRYAGDHRRYPSRIIYGSENSHQYDAWLAVRDNDYIAGQFLWTGIDYLGEAGAWPNRASGSGLLDLCGFKKPLAWFRQSLWSAQPMVYLCVTPGNRGRRGLAGMESWNWPENSTVTVLCFANCPEVTLTLNGKVVGTRNTSTTERGVLNWQVPYEPGVLKVVGHGEGRELCSYALHTAGGAERLELRPDSIQLHANGQDICHVEFQIVDGQGVRVPDAAPKVMFDLTGPANLLGIGNGDLSNIEDCKTNWHSAFHGRGLAVLQTTSAPGPITLKATASGLQPAIVTLQSQ